MAIGDSRNLLGDGDPLVWTPSAVRAELDRIRGVIDTTNVEMSGAVKAGKMTGDEWNQWFHGVYEPAHKLVDDASTLWGSNVQLARQHEQAALKWRETILARGAAPVGPGKLGRDPSPPTNPLTWLGVGAGTTGLLIALGLGYILMSKK